MRAGAKTAGAKSGGAFPGPTGAPAPPPPPAMGGGAGAAAFVAAPPSSKNWAKTNDGALGSAFTFAAAVPSSILS